MEEKMTQELADHEIGITRLIDNVAKFNLIYYLIKLKQV
jgi:hypothetical protein